MGNMVRMTNANAPRDCAYPGDQEHDHEMCRDANVEFGHPVPHAPADRYAHPKAVADRDMPTYPKVLAERYAGLLRRGREQVAARARLYAHLHAFMAYLAANPHLPVPTAVTFSADVADLDELQRIAVAHDVHVYPAESPRQLTVWPIGQKPEADLFMPFHVSTEKEDRPL